MALSTTVGYHSEFTTNVETYRDCRWANVTVYRPLPIERVTAKFSFPFHNLDIYFDGCHDLTHHHAVDLESYALDSKYEFFVFVGVTSFRYCIAAVIYYVCLENPAKCGPGGTRRKLKSFATVVSNI